MRSKIAALVITFAVGILASNTVWAGQIKSVQTGEATLGTTDTEATVTVTSVDTSKSIILVSQRSKADTYDDYFCAGDFQNAATLKIFRGAANDGKSVTVRWHVVEFKDSVLVQRGVSTIGRLGNEVTVNLPTSLDTNKSMIIVNPTTTEGSISKPKEFFPRAEIVSSSQIKLRREMTPAPNYAVDVSWQVVEFQSTDVSVQKGLLEMAGTDQSKTQSIDTVDMTKSFLALSFSSPEEDQIAMGVVRGEVTNATTLTFYRSTVLNPKGKMYINWYLVTFADRSTIQKGLTVMTNANTANETITTVDTTRTFPIGSYSSNETSKLYDVLLTGELSNNTTFKLKRETKDEDGRIAWFVAQLPALKLKAPNGSELWRVGETQNITWSFSDKVTEDPDGAGSAAHHRVKIELSTDGGSTFPLLIAENIDGSLGTYSWAIPSSISSTNLIDSDLRVKITDTDDTTIWDDSNANFEIKGSVTLTAPDGGEIWIVGEANRDITWTKIGDLSYTTLTIKLSENGGTSYDTTIASSVTAAAGSYSWNPIPDKIGSDRRIRIELAADPSGVYDASSANFTIKGKLTLTAPNGLESWPAQTSQTITWNKTGTFSTVTLYYSTDSGLTYPNTIAAGVSAGSDTGSYSWTVPTAAVSTAVRVKIASDQAAAIQASDESDADFSVVHSILVTSPNAGSEVWRVGESKNINWTLNNGSISTVKLEYSTDAGSSWVSPAIATGVTASNGTYAWTIPDAVGDQVQVRVSDEAAPSTFYDASDNNFKVRGKITVASPNGGEGWGAGTSQTITWTRSGSFGNVDILYSNNGGSSFPTTLATDVSGTQWAWNPISSDPVTTARIRVQATNASYSADTADDSDAHFEIKKSLTLTSPNDGETWTVGESRSITWTMLGSVSNVKLEYSTNGFSDETKTTTITSSASGSALSYAWTVSDAIGTNLKVRITDTSDSTVKDTSDSVFKITGSLLLLTPNGEEELVVDSTRSITWSKVGTFSGVKLEYSTDGGQNYIVISHSVSAANLAYSWTVPDAIGGNVKVRVSNIEDAAVRDESNGVFKIKGSLTLMSPNGGEEWIVENTHDIKWTKTGTFANVKLEYSTDGGKTYAGNGFIIDAAPAKDLIYAWTIPDAIGANLKVRITNVDDSSVYDESNKVFKIKGSLTLTAPDGGEVWVVGSGEEITWTKTGTFPDVKLEYSTDGGKIYSEEGMIVESTAVKELTYHWTISDAIGSNLKVRIVNVDDATVLDESNGAFKIKGSLKLKTPRGGEIWDVGANQDITWTKTGSILNVKLEYSMDGGKSYWFIESVPATEFKYAWMVPNHIGDEFKIRISNMDDSNVQAESNAFSIKGSLLLTIPNGGEKWGIGTEQKIAWSKTANFSNLKLEYSTDGGKTYPHLIEVVAGSDSEFLWKIPDTLTAGARVRISDEAGNALDASDNDFKISPSLVLLAPNGGEALIPNEGKTIAWETGGTVSEVTLEYSIDGGTTYSQLIAKSIPNKGSYSWIVPNLMTKAGRIRVSSASDPETFDVSDNDFLIQILGPLETHQEPATFTQSQILPPFTAPSQAANTVTISGGKVQLEPPLSGKAEPVRIDLRETPKIAVLKSFESLGTSGLSSVGSLLMTRLEKIKEILSSKRKEPEPVVPAASEIEGTQWEINIIEGSNTFHDRIRFKEGLFYSDYFARLGFEVSRFSVSRSEGRKPIWQATLTGPDGKKAFWRGEWQEGSMSGEITRQGEEGSVHSVFISSQMSL